MKVAKLVLYSFMTRVIVDDKASDDDIIKASRKMMKLKVDTELGENLEEIYNDDECPIGTFDTDLPSIDRVILNDREKQYIVVGKGLPVQIISLESYSDWDSVQNTDGEPVFDVQMDEDDYEGNGVYTPNFQYVNLIYKEDTGNYEMGLNYQSVVVEVVSESIAEIVLKLLQKN